jgi:hypothetical protein
VFEYHNMPGPYGFVRLLRAYALGSSRNARSLAFTFDWYRAARYALYRCGETLEHSATASAMGIRGNEENSRFSLATRMLSKKVVRRMKVINTTMNSIVSGWDLRGLTTHERMAPRQNGLS